MTRLMMRALAYEETERRPLWIMRQAGRYLPEYRALRAEHSFEELCADPKLACEVTLQPLRRFPFDASIVFADLMTPLAAMGVDFRFDPGPVVGKPVRDEAAVRALRVPEGPEIAPEVPETLRLVRAAIPESTTLLGFAGAPFSLACYLVEGQGGRGGFPTLRAMLHSEPALFGELMERLATLSARYLIEQHRAGADAVQVFDTWAGELSEPDWREHVAPHLRALLEELGRAGVPRILFLNGAPHLLEGFAAMPSEALALDWRVDLPSLREKLGPKRPLQGNLDPAVLLAGPEATAAAARALMRALPKRGHVFNLGHGILPNAPIESVAALVEAVHEESP